MRVASLKPDGSLRKLVIVWVVRNGDDLYVRSVYGREAAWFRGATARHEGRVESAELVKNVTFVEVGADDDIQKALDHAYRTKYRTYDKSYVDAIVSQAARSATLRLDPRSPQS